MSATTDFDRRLGDWLEDGPQTVPDWLVAQAFEQARATRQVRVGRLPWARRPPVTLGRPVPVAAGAVAGLAVVAAFVLGLLAGPRAGDEPTPAPSASSSPGPASSVTPRPLGAVERVAVLPGETPDFVSLIGIAATADGNAAWTVAVTGAGPRLVRIDAASGAVATVSIDGAGSLLSPPVTRGDVVWTGSAAGLHAIPASGEGSPQTVPLGFVPVEIEGADDGLWVAREGGASLIDPATGEVLREVTAPSGTLTGRVVGGPALGRMWACLDPLTLAALDPMGGAVVGTTTLPAGSDCHGRVFAVAGVAGIPDGLIPYLASVVIAPGGSGVIASFDVGAWSDVVAIDGRLWFLEILRGQPGAPLALVELDPGSLRPARILTFDGSLYLNTAFESGYLAVAGDSLWVLADPNAGGGAASSPQIVRVPLAQLQRT